MKLTPSFSACFPFKLPLSTILCLATMLLASSLHAEVVDKVVAIVNDDIITLSELETEVEGVYQKIAETTPAAEREKAMIEAREQILDTLIDKRLISQKAKAMKVSVTPEEITDAMEQVLQRSNLTKDELLAKLAVSGVDETMYRETLRTQVLQNKLISSEVRSKIVVTDQMVRAFYDSENGTPTQTDTSVGSYHLQQIGTSWQNPEGKEQTEAETEAKKADAKIRIDTVHRLAKDGEDFGELASKYSDLPSAADQGELGTFSATELADYMLSAVSSLKPGDISEIVETPAGFQFFKLLETTAEQSAVPDDFSRNKEEIKKRLYEQEIKKAYSEWAKKLKDDAYIQKL